ncbi:MAG: hypothetical protein JSV44_03205 [Candidatus Zixiibacteriota bacterium]|nr:MAG: hypothetical protein JSV44_03205 [candidate division Zixibacteria bacterium]
MRAYPFILLFLAAFALPVSADIKIDLGVSGGYVQNLLKDSSDLEDSYSTTTAKFNIYPIRSLEFNVLAEYTYYGKTYNLSNFVGGIGFRFIPTSRNSPVSLYLSGNLNERKYRELFKGFDNRGTELVIGMVHRLSPGIHHRTGVSFRSSSYLDSDIADQKNYELFTAWNATFLGSNSLDCEIGFGVARYNSIREDIFDVLPDPETGQVDDTIYIERNLCSFYISPRLSRPIGSKIGLNLTFTHRDFLNSNEAIVYGSSNQYLSPWASVWEGQSITATIKTFLVPKFIITTGAGYRVKTFLKTLEQNQFAPWQAESHKEEESKSYLQLQRPIAFRSGLLIEPSVQIEYTHNFSLSRLYDYTDVSVSGGIIIRL